MTRIADWAEWISALQGWRRAALAFLAGSLLTLSLAPLFLIYILPLSLSLFLWLLRGSQSFNATFWTAWFFWMGFLWAGLYWISFSMLVDAERFAWAIPLGSLVLPAAIAVIPAIGALLMRYLSGPAGISIFSFAVVTALFEWLRGQIFTGLPWNLPGYSLAATDGLLQGASLVGAYGLTLIAVICGASAADLGNRSISIGRKFAPILVACVGLLGFHNWGESRLDRSMPRPLAGVQIRLIQPNIPQAEKWAPEFRERNFDIYRTLAEQESILPITHLIMPEAALPFLLANDADAAAAVAGFVSPDGIVISGTVRRDVDPSGQRQAFNSAAVINGKGELVAVYDKMHLVPWGEYLPFRFLLAPLGLDKIVFGATDYDTGNGPLALSIPGLPAARVLICYEGIFPDEISLAEDVALLINVTNDGWFGQTAGPWQHFEMERMRAVEQGVPLIRAANTGISAVIDANGRILTSLALGDRGVIDSPLPQAGTDMTFYRTYGDGPLMALMGIFLFWRLYRVLSGATRRHETP